jgi:hypothetical protein
MIGKTHSYILKVSVKASWVKQLGKCTPDELVTLSQVLNMDAAVVQAST